MRTPFAVLASGVLRIGTRIRFLETVENPLVRENACWALGYLCARDATSALKDRARDDDNADVRTRASWALAQINE